MNSFLQGVRAVAPLISGIIPFGAVVGAAFSEAKLTLWQTIFMNTIVYAGAAQLATVELMSLKAAMFVVVLTGLTINLRFLLYSAAMAPIVHESSPLVKFLCAFSLTDQSYATMTANQDKFKSNTDAVNFYLGTAACMMITWDVAVIAGYIFGNFAPASWALDFAVPLSFVALLVPTLKNRTYVIVAIFSSMSSLILYGLPMRTGLISTAVLSMLLALWFMRRKR